MSNHTYLDAEYESIRAILDSRGKCDNQLPGKTVRYIPETSRTDAVIALDKRIAALQKYAPLSWPAQQFSFPSWRERLYKEVMK